MELPTRDQVRYHAARWVWVPALALVAHVAFPSSSADVAPLLEPGAPRGQGDRRAVQLRREQSRKTSCSAKSEELAASAKPIYEFRQRALRQQRHHHGGVLQPRWMPRRIRSPQAIDPRGRRFRRARSRRRRRRI